MDLPSASESPIIFGFHGLTFMANFDNSCSSLNISNPFGLLPTDMSPSLFLHSTPKVKKAKMEMDTTGGGDEPSWMALLSTPTPTPNNQKNTKKEMFESGKAAGSSQSTSTPGPQSPPTPFMMPRKAIRVKQKIAYEDRPSRFLIQWQFLESGRKISTWQIEGRESKGCRDLIHKFNKRLADDPELARKFTEYQVEALLDHTIKGERLYLVKFVGWRVPTWEKKENLGKKNMQLVEDFERINAEKEEPIGKGSPKKRGRKRKADKMAIKAELLDVKEEPKPVQTKDGMDNKENGEQQQPQYFSYPLPAAKVMQAVRVISKLDKGNSDQPSEYLVEWPPEMGIRTAEKTLPENCSWEKHITRGNNKVIKQFEQCLKKGEISQESIQYEVEKIRAKKWHTSPGGQKTLKYEVKWRGFDSDNNSWVELELLGLFPHLIKQFEMANLQKQWENMKKKSTEHIYPFDVATGQIPDELLQKFWEIGNKWL